MESLRRRVKQGKSEKLGFDKRSPLQHFNGLRFHKSTSSNLASSTSSRAHLDRKSKVLSAVTPNVMTGSKENHVPRRPFSEKSIRKEHSKPIYQTAQRSKQCAQRNPVKIVNKGSAKLAAKFKSCHGNSSECTPGGKLAKTGFPECSRFDDCKNATENSASQTANCDSATSVKTPPMEASVSPEIQCGSYSKLEALKSAATPVCYGAGHLLSGVTDKRKCRRRGSLRGGCEKLNHFDDDDDDDDRNVMSNSPDSSVPLLAEASVRWHLSPCHKGHEDHGSDSENQLQRCKMNHGNAPLVLDLSTLCGYVSDLGLSSKKIEPLLAATPDSTSCFNSVSTGEEKNVIDNNSAFSLGSLSSGNIIQTPSSDSRSYGCVGGSNVVKFELDSITEVLNAMSLSPRSEMSTRDAPSLSFQCADMYSSSDLIMPIQLQKNGHSVCSWMSDSTLENLAMSQTRISWRDGFMCENDEFDCCPCLSDEEINAVGCCDKQLMSFRASQSVGDEVNDLGIEYRENEANAMKMDLDVSPILLGYEPCVGARGKESVSEDGLNACAESISTNGGDLAASCDSDWT